LAFPNTTTIYLHFAQTKGKKKKIAVQTDTQFQLQKKKQKRTKKLTINFLKILIYKIYKIYFYPEAERRGPLHGDSPDRSCISKCTNFIENCW
jgi:hypothetical protein